MLIEVLGEEKPLVRADLDGDSDLRQQGRSVLEYLEAAVTAWFADTEPPMLLPEKGDSHPAPISVHRYLCGRWGPGASPHFPSPCAARW